MRLTAQHIGDERKEFGDLTTALQKITRIRPDRVTWVCTVRSFTTESCVLSHFKGQVITAYLSEVQESIYRTVIRSSIDYTRVG